MNKLRRILRFLGFNQSVEKNYYQCRHCGYILLKEDAKVSGWDSEHSLRHVHCPRCGKIITHTP